MQFSPMFMFVRWFCDYLRYVTPVCSSGSAPVFQWSWKKCPGSIPPVSIFCSGMKFEREVAEYFAHI
jgi:hypothetical protein